MDRRTCYEVLGLAPGAPPEQVERAYRFYRDLYRENSLATYSLLSPQELLAARARVQEAYDAIADPAPRVQGEASLGVVTVMPAPPGPSAGLFPVPAPLVMPVPAALGSEAPAGDAESREGAAPVAPPVLATPPAPEPFRLPEPVTGAALKALRLAQGVSLRDIANQSKIGVRFLEYLEADRFSDLPAPVYIRGFLREYARACGLDAQRIADSYLSRLVRP